MTRPEKVVFLGDLFHSSENSDWKEFETFIATFPQISFELVLGNHDIIPAVKLSDVLDQVFESAKILPPFILSHYPSPHEEYYNLCGHIHPAVKLKGKARQSVLLPCFIFSISTCILPAFGTFTGTQIVKPKSTDDVFIIAEGQVINFNQ